MQIELLLSADEIRLPMAYQYLVQSLIYHTLALSPNYVRFLHDRGYDAGGKPFKCFTFGRLGGAYRIADGRIVFSGGCTLEIRSCDPYLIQLLLLGFAEGTVHRLGSNRLTVGTCRLQDRHIIADAVDIAMLAPLTVYQTWENGYTDYASPNEPRFYEWIRNNAEKKWNSLMPFPLNDDFLIEPLAVAQRDKVVTTYKDTHITGWMGSYRLRGARQLLDLLYQIGIGVKNSQGFGMFEVL